MSPARPSLWLLLLALGGCHSDDAPPAPAPPRPPHPSAAPRGAAAPSAVAPARTFYLGDASGKCTVYWEQGERRSVALSEPCPREIEPGERIRLTDRVCYRESPRFGRAVPVRCPKALVQAARDTRQGRGERVLRARRADR